MLINYQDAQANGFVANVKSSGASKMGIIHAFYGKFDNRCLQSADSRPWFLRTRTWAIRGTLGVHPICTNSSLAVSLFGVTWTCDDQHVCPSLDLSLQVTGWCVVLFPSWSLSEVDFFFSMLGTIRRDSA